MVTVQGGLPPYGVKETLVVNGKWSMKQLLIGHIGSMLHRSKTPEFEVGSMLMVDLAGLYFVGQVRHKRRDERRGSCQLPATGCRSPKPIHLIRARRRQRNFHIGWAMLVGGNK